MEIFWVTGEIESIWSGSWHWMDLEWQLTLNGLGVTCDIGIVFVSQLNLNRFGPTAELNLDINWMTVEWQLNWMTVFEWQLNDSCMPSSAYFGSQDWCHSHVSLEWSSQVRKYQKPINHKVPRQSFSAWLLTECNKFWYYWHYCHLVIVSHCSMPLLWWILVPILIGMFIFQPMFGPSWWKRCLFPARSCTCMALTASGIWVMSMTSCPSLNHARNSLLLCRLWSMMLELLRIWDLASMSSLSMEGWGCCQTNVF